MLFFVAMMKACFDVGGGGCAPALTARKLGMSPRIRWGCCFESGTGCPSPFAVGGVVCPSWIDGCGAGAVCCVADGASGNCFSWAQEITDWPTNTTVVRMILTIRSKIPAPIGF